MLGNVAFSHLDVPLKNLNNGGERFVLSEHMALMGLGIGTVLPRDTLQIKLN